MKLANWLEDGMLIMWWEINPSTYMEYYNRFGHNGEIMLNQLAKDDYEFYYKLYQLGGHYRP